jgi:hypothetical protein
MLIPVSRTARSRRAAGTRLAGTGLPGHRPVAVAERAGRGVRADGRHRHDDLRSLGDGLVAAVAVQVGSGEAGLDRVDLHARQRFGVLEDQHDHRGLGRGVSRSRQTGLHPGRVGEWAGAAD